jgi:hypothetical protein
MGWVSAEQYTTAKPDPLAEAAMGIIQHMNADHAAALSQITEHYAGEAVMTAVDRLHLRAGLSAAAVRSRSTCRRVVWGARDTVAATSGPDSLS